MNAPMGIGIYTIRYLCLNELTIQISAAEKARATGQEDTQI